MFSIITLLLIFGVFCTSEDNECEKHKWENPLDYSPQPRLILGHVRFLQNDSIYDIKEASEVFFSATIYKVHCNGTHSQHYDYVSSFDPRILNDEALQKGIYVGQPITFTFRHDKDYLVFNYTIEASWENNEKAIGSANNIINHTDILPDIEFLKEYFVIRADVADQVWTFTAP